jgi:hypothetical protein
VLAVAATRGSTGGQTLLIDEATCEQMAFFCDLDSGVCNFYQWGGAGWSKSAKVAEF